MMDWNVGKDVFPMSTIIRGTFSDLNHQGIVVSESLPSKKKKLSAPWGSMVGK